MITPYTSTACFTTSCADGLDGTPVTECASAESIISQLDADKKADIAARTKAYAALSCAQPGEPEPVVYLSLPLAGNRNCTNCAGPYVVPITVPAGAFYSLVSQQAADDAAAAFLAEQTDPSACGNTLYYNDEQTATVFCPVTGVGTPSSSTVPAGTYCSDVSKQLANEDALAAAIAAADAALVCLFGNTQQTATVTCAAPPYGPPSVAVIEANTYTSNISVVDADVTAAAAALAAATAGLVCYTYQNAEQTSATPDCEAAFGPQYSGPAIDPVVVPAGQYFSNVSQLDADTQAAAAADAEYLTRLLCDYDPTPPP